MLTFAYYGKFTLTGGRSLYLLFAGGFWSRFAVVIGDYGVDGGGRGLGRSRRRFASKAVPGGWAQIGGLDTA